MRIRLRTWGEETPIFIKLCTEIGVADLIATANICDYRLRGFGVVGGRMLGFPIDFCCRCNRAAACTTIQAVNVEM